MDKNYSSRRKDVIETCESASISPKESIYDYGYDDGKKEQLLKDKELIGILVRELEASRRVHLGFTGLYSQEEMISKKKEEEYQRVKDINKALSYVRSVIEKI